jgi:undecaprenyl-diphosphatase
MGWLDAVTIGLLQAVAIMPGISRSGSTISMATRRGLAREEAATFSFLLGMIAISGAIVLKSKDLFDASQVKGATLGPGVLSLGFVVSAGVGYVALRLLIRTLKRGKFALFSYYCLAMAVLGFIAAIIRQ